MENKREAGKQICVALEKRPPDRLARTEIVVIQGMALVLVVAVLVRIVISWTITR